MSLMNIDLPTNLHRHLRLTAAARGITMKAAVAEAAEAWVRANAHLVRELADASTPPPSTKIAQAPAPPPTPSERARPADPTPTMSTTSDEPTAEEVLAEVKAAFGEKSNGEP